MPTSTSCGRVYTRRGDKARGRQGKLDYARCQYNHLATGSMYRHYSDKLVSMDRHQSVVWGYWGVGVLKLGLAAHSLSMYVRKEKLWR